MSSATSSAAELSSARQLHETDGRVAVARAAGDAIGGRVTVLRRVLETSRGQHGKIEQDKAQQVGWRVLLWWS